MIRDNGPAAPYPAVITVAGLKQGKLLDLNVTLSSFEHRVQTDVDILLIAPNGRSAVILSDIGGNVPVRNVNLVLDDQAPAILPLPQGPLVSGSFRPWNQDVPGVPDLFPPPAGPSANVALSTFNGINPNGAWKLFVVDDASGDTGLILGGWALTIKARVRV